MRLSFIVSVAILAVIAINVAAFAQDAPKPTEAPATTVAPPAAPTKFVLEFDQTDITTLNQCVGEIPFKIAQPFVTKMNAQMAPQLAKQGKPAQ